MSWVNSSMTLRRSSRRTPPWMVTTASGRPSRSRMRSARYSRVSRCSVKMMILRRLPSASVISVVVGEQVAQLGPLPVGAAVPDPAGQLDQVGEERDLLVQLGDRCGRRWRRRRPRTRSPRPRRWAGRRASSVRSLGAGPGRAARAGAGQALVRAGLARRRSASRGGASPAACGGVPATSGSPPGWTPGAAAGR